MAPATVEGAVAPAMPAESSSTGMPPLMQASITSQDSVANFIGGTTKQFELLMNGRSRHLFSPPAIMCSISNAGATIEASENEMPTCLVVPEMQE